MRAVHLVPAAAVLVALGAIGGVAQLGHPATAQRPATSGPGVLPGRDPAGAGDLGGPRLPARAGRWRGPGRAPGRRIQRRTGSSTAGSSTAGHGPTDQVELTALPPVGLPVRADGPVRAQSPGALALLTLPAAKATGKQAAGQQAAAAASRPPSRSRAGQWPAAAPWPRAWRPN